MSTVTPPPGDDDLTPPEPAERLDVDLVSMVADEPDERELKDLMKAWRKGRATQSVWSAISESYVTVFSLVVLGAMVISLLVQTQQNAASCTTDGCLSARALLPWALFAGVGALGAMLARLFGPVLASAAEGFWLLDAPIRRRRFLFGRLVAILVVTALACGALGALLAALVGLAPLGIVAWAVATGLGAGAVVAFAAAEQGAERTALVRVCQALCGLAAVGVMAAVVGISAGWLGVRVGVDTSVLIAWAAAAASALVLGVSFVMAAGRLHLIRRARLQSGGSLVAGMQGAAFALDFGLMRDILVEREMLAKGHVTPTRGRGTGPMAIVWRDVQRVFRSPVPVLVVLASAIVPYAVSALGLSRMNPFLSGLVLCFLLIPLMGSLRVLSRTPGLLRMMPFSTGQVRTAAIAVPAVLALIWALIGIPAFADVVRAGTEVTPETLLHSVQVSLLVGFAGLLGAMRWTVAKSTNYAAPTMATSMGAVPPTMVFGLFRGIDMVALVTFPIVLGLPMWVSIGIGLICFMVLRGGMNAEELQAEQERQKRLAEEARKAQQLQKERIRLKR